MNLKKNWITKTGVCLCLPILVVFAAVTPAQSQNLAAGDKVIWQLTDANVLKEGKTVNTDNGKLTDGYLVEATATAVGEAPVPEGFFQLTCSAFQPKKEMPGQEPSVWYIQGIWTITDKNVDDENLKLRHSKAKVKGIFSAELPFNPITGSGSVEARVKWPLTLIGNHWAQGDGIFNGNAMFEGQIDLTLLRWQKVK
jgi:hypothetical protein